MDKNSLIERWKRSGIDLHRLDRNMLAALGLDNKTVNHMVEVGLPSSASPWLEFDVLGDDIERFGRPVKEMMEGLPDEVGQYVSIGFNGSGDHLTVDCENGGVIWVLDHDDDFKPMYVNADLPTLNLSLLAYQDFVEKVIAKAGDMAYLDGIYDLEAVEELQQILSVHDSKAVQSGTFWSIEIQTLLANRTAN
ncbi:MAG: SUKH-4 family immunity protein [Flavobacteriales bacterium]